MKVSPLLYFLSLKCLFGGFLPLGTVLRDVLRFLLSTEDTGMTRNRRLSGTLVRIMKRMWTLTIRTGNSPTDGKFPAEGHIDIAIIVGPPCFHSRELQPRPP